MKKLLCLIILGAGITGCSVDPLENSQESIESYDAKTNVQNDKPDFLPPSISCGDATTQTSLELVITPGETGAMGGFDLHWMTKDSYDTYGWNEEYACGVGLASNNNNNYGLEAGDELPLFLEEHFEDSGMDCTMPLECGQEFVFKIRAKNSGGDFKKSDWSEVFFCSTAACEICTYGFGYWKNHEEMWPVEELSLGGTTWDKEYLLALMNTQPDKGDAITTLTHHLITAKLNVANGAGNSEIEEIIEVADMMVSDPESYTKAEINNVKDQLEAFNEGSVCDEEN
ncbi:hypothetical protein [Salegentibacter chungangensis]|uniref:Lipoprotein n=1 Tax=Salegentibacter chungangensis TaxID=1335724 RepID=A0ABW3NR14_9FLAO